jgi:hypothetical protein
MSFLIVLAVYLNSNPFLLVNAEKEEQQEYYLLDPISSLSFDIDGAAFISGLENLIKNFEYTFDLDGSQIFPNNDIKQAIVSEYKSSNYNIDDLGRKYQH